MLMCSLFISIQICVPLSSSFQIDLLRDLDIKPYAVHLKYQIKIANKLSVYMTVCSVFQETKEFFFSLNSLIIEDISIKRRMVTVEFRNSNQLHLVFPPYLVCFVF